MLRAVTKTRTIHIPYNRVTEKAQHDLKVVSNPMDLNSTVVKGGPAE